jgi:hypothetical protein
MTYCEESAATPAGGHHRTCLRNFHVNDITDNKTKRNRVGAHPKQKKKEEKEEKPVSVLDSYPTQVYSNNLYGLRLRSLLRSSMRSCAL